MESDGIAAPVWTSQEVIKDKYWVTIMGLEIIRRNGMIRIIQEADLYNQKIGFWGNTF
jgi:hypothetical protein